jgi:hypothetical protein
MTVLGKVRLGALVVLMVALAAVPRAARAQETPPPVGNAAPTVTPGPAAGNDAPPAPPTAQPSSPPPGQPGYPPPGQPGYPPPGQGYPPGYAPPGYAPGYAPPGYPPGYAPPPRYAPPAPAEPTHTGTYVHLHLGGGFTSISGPDGNGGTIKLAGGGPAFAVAVGGAPIPNLAVFGSLFFTGASQPKVTGNGYSVQTTGDALVGGFGAGLVYYFMPANIYLSGAVATLSLQADDSNGKTTYTSDYGVGFDGIIGKEFFVSEHWGLGGALEFVGASSMKDKDNPNISWSAAAFNLLLSATYF